MRFCDHFFVSQMKKRDDRVKSLRSSLEQKQKDEETRELTLSPRLVTSSKLRNNEASRTPKELYDHLYSWHGFYTRMSVKRKEQEEANFRSTASFIPRVNENSRKLVERRASSRSQSRSRSRTRRNSFDASSINTESIMLSSKASRDVNNFRIDVHQSHKVTTTPTSVVYEVPSSAGGETTFFGPSDITVPAVNQDIIEKLQSINVNEMSVPVKDESYWKNITSQQSSAAPVVHPFSPTAVPADVNMLKVDNKWQFNLDDLSLHLPDDDQEDVFHRLYNTVRSLACVCARNFLLFILGETRKE
jgi:hypothetical protein